jgi:hypothetical protein
MRWWTLSCSCLALLTWLAATASAQRYEIHPYAGGLFPGKFAGLFEVEDGALYGLKGGVYLTNALEAEGHIGYVSNLAFDGTLTRKRGYIWEGLVSYNFTLLHILPKLYGTAGIGGLTTGVSADGRSFWGSEIPAKDVFLSLTYGGGIKALRQWGPLGYRAELRARTLPDYYGFRFTWPEASAGLTLSWGGNSRPEG